MKRRVRLDYWADTEKALKKLKPQSLKQELRKQFEALEKDPEQFEELRSLSPTLAEEYPDWVFRKIK